MIATLPTPKKTRRIAVVSRKTNPAGKKRAHVPCPAPHPEAPIFRAAEPAPPAVPEQTLSTEIYGDWIVSIQDLGETIVTTNTTIARAFSFAYAQIQEDQGRQCGISSNVSDSFKLESCDLKSRTIVGSLTPEAQVTELTKYKP